MRRIQSRVGFSLVEVIVALAILQMLLLGVFALLHRAAALSARGVVLEVAIWEATALADSMDVLSVGDVARPWGTMVWGAGMLSASDSTGEVLVQVPLGGTLR